MLGIVDDAFQSWAEAQSPTIRETVWQWWQGTFQTRMWEDSAIVHITTRWHQDDLAGRLLQREAGEWTVLRFPALGETQEERDENDKYLGLPTGQPDWVGRKPGEALCPKRFSAKTLEQTRLDVGSRVWAAEYDGVPRPLEGDRFKRDWFKILERFPSRPEKFARYWDKASTEGGGSLTAGVLMAKCGDAYVIADVVEGAWSAARRDRAMLATARRDETMRQGVQIYHEQEPGSGGKDSADATNRLLAGFNVHSDRVTGSKDSRLEPLAAAAEAGNVYLLRGDWNAAFLEELCALPGVKQRDRSDAAGGGYTKLAKAQGWERGMAE